MSNRQITRNIALTPHFERYVRAKVAAGRYQSASEVVREALRLLEHRDRLLEREVSSLREDIEVGWGQSERGEMLDGPSLFAEIRKLSKSRRGATKPRR